jgi:hypothetical protein
VVIPLERRATKQSARKGASHMGFAPLWPVDAETRLMDIIETASDHCQPCSSPMCSSLSFQTCVSHL